jgi:hypothetical protein
MPWRLGRVWSRFTPLSLTSRCRRLISGDTSEPCDLSAHLVAHTHIQYQAGRGMYSASLPKAMRLTKCT